MELVPMIAGGDKRRELVESKTQGGSLERVALYSMVQLAAAAEAIRGYGNPLSRALFQYKAGIELHAPDIAKEMPRLEVQLQKHLCRFLLERGIFAVGTRFGQSETDLVARVGHEYTVIECKVYDRAPTALGLERDLGQLLRYDNLNPVFRDRGAVLVIYNYGSVSILEPPDMVHGVASVIVINAKSGPPSETKECIRIVSDGERGIRCFRIGRSPQTRKAQRTARR